MSERRRRDFLRTSIVAMLAGAAAAPTSQAEEPSDKPLMKEVPKSWHGDETIAMLIYPGFTALDLFGPHHFFISMMGAKVLLVAKDEQPVPTDSKVKILPTTTFADCPKKLTVLFVPGGTRGTLAAAQDEATRAFVADRGANADWVASVCTGSLVLGAAGLLEGYKATSHWLALKDLAHFGATPVDERVVVDRNRITGAGVTSGLDFGLRLVKDLRGEEYAKLVQLFSEYDPTPPLNCGSVQKSAPESVAMLRTMHQEFNDEVRKMAEAVRGARPKP